MSESAKNLNEMVVKLKEIDNVFKFGEKMIPVIEGFVSFISDFVPFVEQVSGSIEDSRSKIPEASSQIDKVTNATELAMTEVLDKIDEINEQLLSINECMDEMIEKRESAAELISKLKVHLVGKVEAEELLNKLTDSIDVGLTLEMVKNKIGEITASADQITMSLQVQDITSQQLAAVNHLIISVQHKLGGLLNAVESTGFDRSDDLKMDKLPDVHFDAKADYNPSANQQVDVDSIINSEKASQEEIDKLFS
jgi:chemotaxis regulatin CheY-phosphate phosphatase CheZ